MAVIRPEARGASAAKSKTRAKERYLKAKKLRRKSRKPSVPKTKCQAASPTHSEHEKDAFMQEESEDDTPTTSDTDQDEHQQDTPESEPAAALPESIAADPLQADPVQQSAAAEPEYLFRFPKPRNTSSLDPAMLASLGIPSALAHPTVVDAAKTKDLDDAWDNATDPALYNGISVSRAVKQRLADFGIKEWFAVQASVIPILLDAHAESSMYMPYNPPRDLCVSAPTGSGKTLAYTVPIIELLRTRTLVQLRALVLVPTRDLALQVGETFDAVGRGSGLRTAVVTGNHSLRHEQKQLVKSTDDGFGSNVDILIATPGRLVDHLRGTPGLTLQHLRFLVVDEADRLLGQSFQQWVPTLLHALAPSNPPPVLQTYAPPELQLKTDHIKWAQDDLEAPAQSVQKLLFSATLTRDLSKMDALQLRNARYISVRDGEQPRNDALGEHFATPARLREYMIVTETSNKVLQLLRLLHAPVGPEHEPVHHALVFAKSVDAANRLVRLVSFFEDDWAKRQGTRRLHVQYYSSDLSAVERAKILRQFQQGEIDVLVCSDLIARGIDLPEVRHVVLYDVPVDIAKYIHRVGRTARAGRVGDAWSLVEEQEVYHFKRMLREANHLDRVQTEKTKNAALDEYVPCYKAALSQLAAVYSQQRL
ncbi:RNA helicase [Malassezia vespertilionis]|uniref:ATP-dependent RNA helicase n=1 Tax=Malassezia vespertilionis TaxID=2020962 RepID=A0A2N1J867_9BASI|nr:RNA helicase [Malassezia vespertilionis]PKI82750.1 Dbp6p [Malassezia vespertilionis]WFD08207.1 RNA helicase [Malassezia vespertilionis]